MIRRFFARRQLHNLDTGEFRVALFYQDDPPDSLCYDLLEGSVGNPKTGLVNEIEEATAETFSWRTRLGASLYMHNPMDDTDTKRYFISIILVQ